MKMFILLALVLFVFGDCNLESTVPASQLNTDMDSTKVLLRYNRESSKFVKVDRADLTKKFDGFYIDKNRHFFIKSYGHRSSKEHEIELVDVFIEIPELDSASFKSIGLYLMDNSKVICVYLNSDGGNFVLLKDADPRSFKVFENAFGGKDKNHVYYQANKLAGLDPATVKVYSNTKNCSNCMAYFTDGKTCYFGEEKQESKGCIIPPEYSFVK
jgi:hypothetical protein